MPAAPAIEIRVLERDGLTYRADALVLKYAQALYGLDRRVVARIGIPLTTLPAPNHCAIVREPDGLAAAAVLFIGVEPLGAFSYPDIRAFGYEALRCVAREVPDATEIALTLHGVGFGLDEVACVEAEVAGILDAVRADELPRDLRTVTFLEFDHDRAERMRVQLASLTESGAGSAVFPRAQAASGLAGATAERLRGVAKPGDVQEYAFVAMPFDTSFTDVFHYGMSSAIHEAGLLCQRIDQQAFTGDIVARLTGQIRLARVVVADLTGDKANVFLEVGYAWGCGVPTVLVCQEGSELQFDVQGQRCIFYGSIMDLEGKLKTELAGLLKV